MKKFNHLVYAGTFDRLHIGHKKLLDMAFELGEKVSIGIATEKLYKSKPLADLILTYEVRKREVEQYLRERNWLKRGGFFRLEDIYGPSIVDKSMDSILVSKFTKENAERINKIRVGKGLPELKIIVAPLVMGEDGEVVTSERIRMGEMDREGHNNFQFPISNFQKETLFLPKYLRKELRKPLGKVVSGSEDRLFEAANKTVQSINRLYIKPPLVISVGDIVTMSMLKIGFDPDVKIIDLKSRRKSISEMQFLSHESLTSPKSAGPLGSEKIAFPSLNLLKQKIILINKAGTINKKAVQAIKIVINNFLQTNKKQLMIVKGEEDLLALPAILLAPLHSIVLYGQIDMGIIVVDVTEEKKKEVEKILKKFK